MKKITKYVKTCYSKKRQVFKVLISSVKQV